jgi:hypothetical protein
VLAPALDRGELQAEATVVAVRNAYAIPISLHFYAPIHKAQATLDYLLKNQLEIRGQRTYVQAPAPNYDALLKQSIAFDPRSVRESSDKFGMSIKDLENLPLAKQPKQVTTKMLPYQLQGLAWMLQMEHPLLPHEGQVRQFWTRKGMNWFNVATKLYLIYLFV